MGDSHSRASLARRPADLVEQVVDRLVARCRDATGRYNRAGIDRLNHVLRCHYTGEVAPIDLRVIEFLRGSPLKMARLAGVPLVAALMSSGCAPTVSGPLQPLVVGAEHHLTIDWHLARSDRAVVVWGYVSNQSPYTFDRVRLLVDALGPDGQIISQQVVWAVGLLGSWGRNYFEAPMVPTHAYRVRVFSYDRVRPMASIAGLAGSELTAR
jgi:hypothetical protein